MILNRRQFLASTMATAAPQGQRRRPNVVFVLTDDQGYGDLSLYGNPQLKTPHCDAIGREGVQFSQFQVSPVCSPTRSSLMTGRYNYRTGVVDTFLGRSLMYPDEVTIAEILRDAGYRTGIFGKWHLGDNYPMRAMDQGFQEALVIKGGGIGQPSDPPGSGYFNPVLQHNGQQKSYPGYCTDVFFDAALQWIETGGDKPFFAYIPTNAPHSPLIVGEEWAAPYRKMGLPEDVAKTYGMVANIDFNVGKLTAKLRALNLERETFLIFMTDNGATGPSARYNAGMRSTKGTPYQGGIRVPCFFHWPGTLKPRTCDRIAAHIDLLPTILEACGVAQPGGLQLDGKSLWPLARAAAGAWPDRMLFTQWHRGDRPEPFRASAARTQRYKLVDGKELYDMESDPAESRDIAAANPEVVAKLRKGYSDWFESVSSVRHYLSSKIHLGTRYENPVVLTRQDWRVPADVRQPVGWWEVDVKKAGKYDIRMFFDALAGDSEIRFQLGDADRTLAGPKGAQQCRFESVDLAAGAGQLRGSIQTGKTTVGPKFVEIKSL